MALCIKIKKRLGSFELNIDLETDNRRIGILGESGAGKSMLLKCIAGIVTPDEGIISIDGRILYSSHEHINLKPQKRKAGYMFQNYALFPNMTVEENIAVVLKKSSRKKRVYELIEQFSLNGAEKKRPNELSGGQQQRAALARLMASEPEIIMLDEAFSALDAHLKERLQLNMLDFISSYGGIVIDVAHDRDEIYKIADYSAVIHNGKISSQGNAHELFENPRTAAAARLTGCRNISPVRIIGKRRLYACDWGCELDTECDIPDNITAVGIRAHDIYEGCGENSLVLSGFSVLEEPFEVTYILRPSCGKGEIWWKIHRSSRDGLFKNGFPKTVVLPKEKLLLLCE